MFSQENPEAIVWRCFVEKGVLRNFATFTEKHLNPEPCSFIKNKTLAQVFSCECYENF